ncbi:MAG TPA: hypothetical protein VE959_26215 [Bryobacteraceae bacterium]|nr:hypothetical protein [Bryobacteraceae bacterium]
MFGTPKLTADKPTPALTCSTLTGPGSSVDVTLTAPAGSVIANYPAVVALPNPLPNGITATLKSGSSWTLTAAGKTTVVTFNAANGCAGLVAGSGNNPVVTFTLQQSGGSAIADVVVTPAITVTAAGTPLSAAPVTLTCLVGSSSDTQTVSVTSTATGGTPFTVNPNLPGWMQLGTVTGSPATATAATFTVHATACSGSAGTSTTVTLHLVNQPAVDKTVAVTVSYVAASPLLMSPSASTLPVVTYNKNSGTPATWQLTVTATANFFFTLDTSTLPNWLIADATTGSITGGGSQGKTINFATTGVADTLSPGLYSQAVSFKVSGYQPKQVTFQLTIKNQLPTLTVAEGKLRNITWFIGQNPPTPFVTAVSSDSAIPYTLTAGGAVAQPSPATSQGVALTSGTQIPVSFLTSAFGDAQPGDTISGTLTLNWASGTTPMQTVVTFHVAVQSASALATVISISPSNLPTAAVGQTFTVTLYGAGFIPSADPTQKTTVGILNGSGAIIQDPNIVPVVVNASTIVLTITVPTGGTDAFGLNFNGVHPVTLGVCNPSGGVCASPTGSTATLQVGAGPLISGITSASAYTAGVVAPYDIISIFGSNFCSSNGTGCGPSTVLYGTPDPVTFTLPLQLSPDANNRLLTVTFQDPTSHTVLASAPLLFATNNQINVLVPSVATTQGQTWPTAGQQVEVMVNFGATGAVAHSPTGTKLTLAATDPGIFTIDGNGDGAILNVAGGLVGQGNEAGVRAVSTDSDQVSIYMSGLGVTTSTTPISTSDATCAQLSSYMSYASLQDIDGAVVQSSLLGGHLPPCILSPSTAVSVSVGGESALVTYAGWVDDSIAGLYQVNVQLPSKDATNGFTTVLPTVATGVALTGNTPVQVPLTVTMTSDGSRASQNNVNIWLRPRLTLTGSPSGNVSIDPTSATAVTTVTASGVSGGTYNYSMTAPASPPTGLACDGTGDVTITSSTPAGTYAVTIKATETGGMIGTYSFNLTVL